MTRNNLKVTDQKMIIFESNDTTPWSLGYGPEDDHFVLELTYNYNISSYSLGNDFQVSKKFSNG